MRSRVSMSSSQNGLDPAGDKNLKYRFPDVVLGKHCQGYCGFRHIHRSVLDPCLSFTVKLQNSALKEGQSPG
jgi:hypothetical protein